LVPGVAVGAVGMPVKAGEASGAQPAPAITNAVVASWVVAVPGAAVGAVGTPVKAGETSSAPPAAVMSAPFKTTAPVRVLNEATPATPEAIALWTKAVVAS
jgi:hypothetical protein